MPPISISKKTADLIGQAVLVGCGLALVGVIIWIIVKALKPKSLASGPVCDTLSSLPNTMVCHEQWISTGYKVDLNADGNNYGYFFKTIDTTSLTKVTFQLVPTSDENVAWVNAETDSYSFNTSYKFKSCSSSSQSVAYELYETFEENIMSAINGQMFTQFNIKKNGINIATSMRTNIFIDEIRITNLDGSILYATLSKDLISSFVVGTYRVTNHKPEILDNWFVAFMAALIIIRTRQQKEERDRLKANKPITSFQNMLNEEKMKTKRKTMSGDDEEATLFGVKKQKRRLTWKFDLTLGPTELRHDEQRGFAMFLLLRDNLSLGFHEWRGLNEIERKSFVQQAEAWHGLFKQHDFKSLKFPEL